MKCPHCSVPLVPELYERVTIDRCPSCSGTWLDAGELTRIVETRELRIPPEVVREALALATSGLPQSTLRTLVPCPKCDGPMDPVNYDHRSGIIIDRCPLGHGNWLDASELEQVQAYREHWDRPVEPPASDRLGFARYVGQRLLRTLIGG